MSSNYVFTQYFLDIIKCHEFQKKTVQFQIKSLSKATMCEFIANVNKKITGFMVIITASVLVLLTILRGAAMAIH